MFPSPEWEGPGEGASRATIALHHISLNSTSFGGRRPEELVLPPPLAPPARGGEAAGGMVVRFQLGRSTIMSETDIFNTQAWNFLQGDRAVEGALRELGADTTLVVRNQVGNTLATVAGIRDLR